MLAIGHTRPGAFHQSHPFINMFARNGTGPSPGRNACGTGTACTASTRAAGGPKAPMAGSRCRPGVPFHLYGVAADQDGRPLMTPVGNTPAISVDGMGIGRDPRRRRGE